MRTSIVTDAFIQGRKVSLENSKRSCMKDISISMGSNKE